MQKQEVFELTIYKCNRNIRWIILWLISIFLMKIQSTISQDIDEDIKQYCREKDRLITSEETDDCLLIDSELNSTIKMQCHFCDEMYNQQPKIWFWQDKYKLLEEKEVNIGMDNNMSLNRIRVTPQLSLIIREFNLNDSGIYRCHGKDGQEVDSKFSYKLEVYKDESTDNLPRGNLTDWQKYHETNLAPVTMRFAVSKMTEIALIRKAGISLELISEWGPWSPCINCKFGKGYKTSRGFCRIKRKINETLANSHNESSITFFLSSPLLPCRSIAMNDFPGISSTTRYLPDFILEKNCKKCKSPKKVKPKKFKYKKRYVLSEGAHLSLSCPESSLDTQVVWRKDAFLLEKGIGHSFRKKDPEPRVFVDTFSTLYLKDVSEFEEGNYTCFVNNLKMMQVKIIVILKSQLLTQVFIRHLAYLGFILILSSFCYCSGLVAIFKRRDKFEIKDYKEILAREQEKKPFFDAKE